MQRITKINALSLGYVLGLIYLIFGILFSLFLLAVKNSTLAPSLSQTITTLNPTQIFLLYPVGYAVGGFLTGLIIGLAYNYIARLTGGISVQLVEVKKN